MTSFKSTTTGRELKTHQEAASNLTTPTLERDLQELATASRILAMGGHEDATLGHVALRDPDGRGVWLKRRGLGLSEVRTVDDFVLVDFDGNKIAGEGRRHSEWPLHTEIMSARPEIRASAHSHPEYATLITALDTQFKLATQDGLRIPHQKVVCYTATADLIRTRERGREVATALGDANVILLRNHGLSFFAESVRELALVGLNIERAARALIRLLSSGEPIIVPRRGDTPELCGTPYNEDFVTDNWEYWVRELERHERRVGLDKI